MSGKLQSVLVEESVDSGKSLVNAPFKIWKLLICACLAKQSKRAVRVQCYS